MSFRVAALFRLASPRSATPASLSWGRRAAPRRGAASLITVGLALIACSGEGGAPVDTSTSAVTTTTLPPPSAEELARAVCAAGAVSRPARVADPALTELSGLVSLDSGLWAHNDSGDEARVFRLDAAGRTQAVVHLEGVTATDWEDMTGAGPTAAELFVGDIGDNAGDRPVVTVLRFPVPEPPPVGEVTVPATEIQTITLHYPDGARDAETLLIDPSTRDLVIVHKRFGGAAEVYQATEEDWSDGDATLERVGIVEIGDSPLDAATAGDVGADGRVVALRTYAGILVFPRDDDQSVAEAIVDGRPCEAPSRLEGQGETIAFTAEGYVTVSEGVRPRLNRFVVAFPDAGE